MTEPTLETLAQRLDRLETLIQEVMPDNGLEGLEAERFTVMDAAGHQRAVVGLLRSGSAFVSLADSTGVQRFTLVVGENDNVTLSLSDKAGRDPLILGVLRDTSSGLTLLDKNGTERATLFVEADGTPNLTFRDSTGQVIWKAP